jgi:nitroreductase
MVSTSEPHLPPELPADTVGLLEGLCTTRAIRRYTDEPVPAAALRAMLFAATRAPSGSNRQPFRFLVLSEGTVAARAKSLIAGAAAAMWTAKRAADGYETGSGTDVSSPKARMAASMDTYVANLARVPVLVFPCLVRHRAPTPTEGASVYPAVQNLLLAARALGYGGVITGFHGAVERELRSLLAIPEQAFIAATVTIGRPAGAHGPVRRRPMGELVFGEGWDQPPSWAVDPAGTQFTGAGPPPARSNVNAEARPPLRSAG